MKSDKNAAFTLIELLVVVLIIGILVAIAVPQYEKAVARARAAEAVTWLRAAVEAQDRYFMANGTFTDDITRLDIELPEMKYYNLAGCTAQCGNCRINAKTAYQDALPSFEFFPSIACPGNAVYATYAGIHWCRTQDKFPTALEVCKGLGTYSLSIDDHRYYQMN